MNAAGPASSHTLPVGTRLRDFEITGLIGEGGFGIVYLAYDHSLLRRVAIKEYMPSSMASRAAASLAVIVKSERHLDTFGAGLRSFVNEARLLARFDHPSLVKVYRFWEENGTAYMAMPYYEGPTLKHALAQMGRPASEAELRAWLRPLLDALAVMHAARCYHRDIAPDNILLTATGPLLLDFGAARRVIGDMTHALTVVLKPGYAPIEQYGDVATMAQGAWTDLYALACVVYFAIQGKPPMSSVERLMADALEPLNTAASGHDTWQYSEPFLHAIDKALSVRPQDRPQSVAEFRDLLDGRSSSAPPAVGFADTASSGLDPEGFQATLPPGMWSPPQVTLPPPVPGAEATFTLDASMLGTTIVRPKTAGFEATSPAAAPVPAPAPVAVPASAPTPAPASALPPAAPLAALAAAPTAALPPAPPVAPPVVVPAADSHAGITTKVSPIAQAPSVAAQTPAWSPPPLEAPPQAPTSPSTPIESRSRKAPLAIVASLAAAALIGALLYVLTQRAPPVSPDAARPASSAASTEPASASAPAPAPASQPNSPQIAPPSAPPITVPTPTPPPSAAASSSTPAPSAAEPSVPAAVPIPAAPPATLPSSATRPASQAASAAATRLPASSATPTAKPRREPAPRPAETAPRPDTSATRSQCSDILQKASLEPLTASEAAFLRRECR